MQLKRMLGVQTCLTIPTINQKTQRVKSNSQGKQPLRKEQPLASLLTPWYTLELNDITWDCHITWSFKVMPWSSVIYWDILGNMPSYCCSKPMRYQTEAWYTLKFSTSTFVHIRIDPTTYVFRNIVCKNMQIMFEKLYKTHSGSAIQICSVQFLEHDLHIFCTFS